MEIWQKNAQENIALLLRELKTTQTEFAKNAKINKNHLNAVLKGHRPVTRQLVATIADYSKKSTEWFYADHSPANDTQESSVERERLELFTFILAMKPAEVSALLRSIKSSGLALDRNQSKDRGRNKA